MVRLVEQLYKTEVPHFSEFNIIVLLIVLETWQRTATGSVVDHCARCVGIMASSSLLHQTAVVRVAMIEQPSLLQPQHCCVL